MMTEKHDLKKKLKRDGDSGMTEENLSCCDYFYNSAYWNQR